MNERMKHIEARIAGIEARMDSIESDIGEIKGKVNGLEITMKEGFEIISRKIDQLARPAAA